jgi:hypothetical protein
VLDHRPDEWLLDVVCHACASHGLVLAEIEKRRVRPSIAPRLVAAIPALFPGRHA